MTTTFRLDRAAALATSGVLVMVGAVCAVAAFWLSSAIATALAVGAVVIAGVYALRPPVVLRLDAEGYRSKLRFSTGRFEGTWAEVEDAGIADGLLVLSTATGRSAFPLRLVGRQRVQVLTAFNEHLNEANGYRRWLG
ncbi:MAG TPA: hypothetical protein VM093_09800 [Aeromicrobium sp.]|nr:hypothetical protein [Aeromicrobium sp.]